MDALVTQLTEGALADCLPSPRCSSCDTTTGLMEERREGWPVAKAYIEKQSSSPARVRTVSSIRLGRATASPPLRHVPGIITYLSELTAQISTSAVLCGLNPTAESA